MSDAWNKREYKSRRFETPSGDLKWISKYAMEGEELQNLIQQNPKTTHTFTVDLTVAQSPQQPLEVNIPGRAFSVKGLTKATIYDPVANTGLETVVTSVLVGCMIGSGQAQPQLNPNDIYLVKHGEGYHGDFLKLYLFWPVQASNAARITIYKYDDIPWMGGNAST